MGKIGRNEKCPCGSGKKYKKCCIDKIEQEDLNSTKMFDIGSILHLRAMTMEVINIDISFKKIYEEFCKANQYNKASVELSDDFFCDFINYVESKIIAICSKYSSYEMLFWYRRIKPTNIVRWFKNNSAYSYHNLMLHCILQFGNRIDNFIMGGDEQDDLYTTYPKSIEPFIKDASKVLTDSLPLEIVNILNSIYELEVYCAYFTSLNNKYRVFIKGGKFKYSQEIGFSIIPKNEEIDFLIRLYDKRFEQNSLLSDVGSFSDDDFRDTTLQQFILVGLQHNFDGEKINLPIEIVDGGSLNFMPFVIDIRNYYNYVRQFNEIYIQKFGFSVEVFLSVLLQYSNYFLSLIQNLSIKPENESVYKVLVNLLQRGYEPFENSMEVRKQQTSQAMSVHNLIFTEKKKENNYIPFLKAINYLFAHEKYHEYYENLEKELLNISFFSQITRKISIVDYTSLVGVLKGFLDPIKSLDGKYGNISSENLENATHNFIVENFGSEKIYVRGKVKAADKIEKEIDASLMIGEYLFVFECKSLSVSKDSILGGKNAVEFRVRKIKEFLDEVDEKATFLFNYQRELNHPIPENIKYIVPVVITSFAEYIWSKENNLFLDENLPRVITVKEIALLNNVVKKKVLKNKPYLKIL